MGNVCCEANSYITDEIINCNSIEQIIKGLRVKINDVENEKNEIKAYLKNHNNIPKSIDFEDMSSEDLRKRVPYITKLQKCLGKVVELLSNKKEANIFLIKKKLSDLYQMYTWVYDDEERYLNWMEDFESFIEEE